MARTNEILLRQYELMVNSACQVTAWRQTTNGFYLTVNTTLLAVATYLFGSEQLTVQVISLIGIAIAILWRQNIEYHRKLNSSKFQVIHRIEKRLPMEIFRLEHEYFKRENHNDATQIEKKIPVLFAIAYAIILLLPILRWMKIV